MDTEPAVHTEQMPHYPGVAEITKGYSIYVTHGIRDGFTPGFNTLLNASATWRDRLEIAVGLRPSRLRKEYPAY